MAQLLPLCPVWCFHLFICQRCMNRLAKVCARYLGGHRGFSIGIEDVTPGTEVRTMQDEGSGCRACPRVSKRADKSPAFRRRDHEQFSSDFRPKSVANIPAASHQE